MVLIIHHSDICVDFTDTVWATCIYATGYGPDSMHITEGCAEMYIDSLNFKEVTQAVLKYLPGARIWQRITTK